MLHIYSVGYRIKSRESVSLIGLLGNGDGDLILAHRLVETYLKPNPTVSERILGDFNLTLLITDVNRMKEDNGY